MSNPSFLAWCQQHGIRTHAVQPGYVSEGWRGVIATEAIAAGTVIMSVPGKLLMSVMSARSSPQLAAVLQQHHLSSHQILAIHLLHEASKGPASFWHPYICQLPPYFTTFMCWPAPAIAALQAQHAQAAATTALENSKSQWMAAWPALQELGLAKKWCSLAAWRWAASCVLSRTMYHPDDPVCGCLTPLADLHNYAPPPPPYTPNLLQSAQQILTRSLHTNSQELGNGMHGVTAATMQGSNPADGSTLNTSHTALPSTLEEGSVCGDGQYDAHTKLYNIVARRRYNPGDQVFLCYGRHSNLDLLDLYGFMLTDNPHEEALLPLQLLQQALQNVQHQQQQQGQRKWRRQHYLHKHRQQHQQQQQLLVAVDIGAADCYIHRNGQPSWQLLKALRLAAASAYEQRSYSYLAIGGYPVSVDSERTTLLSLIEACNLQLQRLPTSLQEDEELLQRKETSPGQASGMTPAPAADRANQDSSAEALDFPAHMQPAAGRQNQHRSADQHVQQAKPQLPASQIDKETEFLAVSWRACYKKVLLLCIEHSRQALCVLGCRSE